MDRPNFLSEVSTLVRSNRIFPSFTESTSKNTSRQFVLCFFTSIRNKKSDSQKKIDFLLSNASSSKDASNSIVRGGKSTNTEDVTTGGQCGGTKIHWLNDIDEALEIQIEEGLEDDKDGKQGKDCSLKGEKDAFSRKLPNKNLKRYGKNSCDEKISLNEGVTGSLLVQEYRLEAEAKPEYKKIADETERTVSAGKTATYSRTSKCAKLESNDIKDDNNSNQGNSEEGVVEHKKRKVKASNATKLKRPRPTSESASTSDCDCRTSLSSRLQANRTSLKKQKTTRMDTSTESQKETDSDVTNVAEDDWDFETPKVRRNVEKRKGVNPSDDQLLCVHNSNVEKAGNSDATETESSRSKKRKTNSSAASGVSKRKGRKQGSRKSNKAPLKTTRTLPTDILEGEWWLRGDWYTRKAKNCLRMNSLHSLRHANRTWELATKEMVAVKWCILWSLHRQPKLAILCSVTVALN